MQFPVWVYVFFFSHNTAVFAASTSFFFSSKRDPHHENHCAGDGCDGFGHCHCRRRCRSSSSAHQSEWGTKPSRRSGYADDVSTNNAHTHSDRKRLKISVSWFYLFIFLCCTLLRGCRRCRHTTARALREIFMYGSETTTTMIVRRRGMCVSDAGQKRGRRGYCITCALLFVNARVNFF